MKTKTLTKIEQEIEVHVLAIAELRRQGIELLGGPPPAEKDPPKPRAKAPAVKKERTPRGEGLPAKILSVLASAPNSPYTADEMIGELKASDKAQQVRTTLSRMVKQGKIQSPDKGKYQAIQPAA